ncbi:MAG: hypothetical protein SFU84_06805 [Gemmatimonadales bacterium]|nr:hypothetical protein [Gemmatimonadales bacterium]
MSSRRIVPPKQTSTPTGRPRLSWLLTAAAIRLTAHDPATLRRDEQTAHAVARQGRVWR